MQLVEHGFLHKRSIGADIPHMKPQQRDAVAVVWLLCCTHQNCSRNDSEKKKQRSFPALAVRFTQCDSMEADHHTEDGKRRETAMI